MTSGCHIYNPISHQLVGRKIARQYLRRFEAGAGLYMFPQESFHASPNILNNACLTGIQFPSTLPAAGRMSRYSFIQHFIQWPRTPRIYRCAMEFVICAHRIRPYDQYKFETELLGAVWISKIEFVYFFYQKPKYKIL